MKYLIILLLVAGSLFAQQNNSYKRTVILEDSSGITCKLSTTAYDVTYGDTISYLLEVENNTKDTMLYFDPKYEKRKVSFNIAMRSAAFDYGAYYLSSLLSGPKMLAVLPGRKMDLEFKMPTHDLKFTEKQLKEQIGRYFFVTVDFGMVRYTPLLKPLLDQDKALIPLSMSAIIKLDSSVIELSTGALPFYLIK
ncbi:MAG: hypothetical protein LWX56_11175 [Ignavibacteria bacterium]|nr:hypothetical protein [Ignavibacteria bacterium]